MAIDSEIINLIDEAKDYISSYTVKTNKSPLESRGLRLAKLLIEVLE